MQNPFLHPSVHSCPAFARRQSSGGRFVALHARQYHTDSTPKSSFRGWKLIYLQGKQGKMDPSSLMFNVCRKHTTPCYCAKRLGEGRVAKEIRS
eukprot:c16020_g1_i2 orf=350-631(+)